MHLAGTYPNIKPRLEGFHHTLDGWRGHRNSDGWKLKNDEIESVIREGRRNDNFPLDFLYPKQHHDGTVIAVKRLRYDLLALGNLFNTIEPPLRLVRGKRIMVVKYGFGDASGSGFGASWIDEEGSISYRYGIWDSDQSSHSSNFRELCNLVDTLEHMASSNELFGVEMFVFTDNSVAEAAFHKGNSSSLLLFNLILRLNLLESSQQMKLHLIHVAGTRMMAQGTDGLSRGNMLDGVMKGKNMLTFIPLDKSALDVQDNLLDWIKNWVTSDKEVSVLSPADWFEKGHDIHGYTHNLDGIQVPIVSSGTYIWAPPPAAADVAIQELRKARHKRQNSTHVFICPRLMKPMWFKQAFKASDMLFDLKAGHPNWSSNHHEPLIVVVCFPYLKHNPWVLRNSPPQFMEWSGYCVICGKTLRNPGCLLCGNYVHSRGPWQPCKQGWCGKCYTADIRVKFHVSLAENDEGNAWKRKQKSEDYLKGFNGAHLMQPFQCDLCWFRNLQKRDPKPTSYKDTMLMAHIRRVNLDILWSRSPSTNYMSEYRKSIKVSLGLGLIPKHYPQGPWPIGDEVGFQVAIEVVGVSLLAGNTSKQYQQFDTIRAIRMARLKIIESSRLLDRMPRL